MYRLATKRLYSTTTLPVKKTVDLAYNQLKASSIDSNKPVFINIHGALGSRVLFNRLKKVQHAHFDSDVYSVDLRNHGASPRAAPYDYMTLAGDIIHFVEKHIGPKRSINLVGFSAGGKIALLTTLSKHINVNKCVSIDLPPYVTSKLDDLLTDNYDLIMKILTGKIKIEKGSAGWKAKLLDLFNALPVNKAANGLSSLYFANGFYVEKENSMKVDPNDKVNDRYIQYNVPLHQMPNYLATLKLWPDLTSPQTNINAEFNTVTSKPVLFIKGNQSILIKNDIELLKKQFPNCLLKSFDGGHNLLMERADDVTDSIIHFFEN